jgi:hypothetical protein
MTDANTKIAAKLPVQQEVDYRQQEAPMAAEMPRRARRLRVAAIIVVLAAVLGIGWGAVVKSHDFVNLAYVFRPVQETASALKPSVEEQGRKLFRTVEELASVVKSKAMVTSARVSDHINTAETIRRIANRLDRKLDQLDASSANAISELGRGIDRLNASQQRSQQELVAKLDLLQERLERVEQRTAASSGTRQPQSPEQLTAPTSVSLPLQPSTPATAANGAVKPAPAATDVKKIENWAVRNVVNGAAILAGPNGIVRVASGDVLPASAVSNPLSAAADDGLSPPERA